MKIAHLAIITAVSTGLVFTAAAQQTDPAGAPAPTTIETSPATATVPSAKGSVQPAQRHARRHRHHKRKGAAAKARRQERQRERKAAATPAASPQPQ